MASEDLPDPKKEVTTCSTLAPSLKMRSAAVAFRSIHMASGSRKAPDRKSEHVPRAGEFTRVVFAIPADEGGVLAGALVFPARLQFDDFWQVDVEEMAIQREVAEKVALPVFHRKNKNA